MVERVPTRRGRRGVEVLTFEHPDRSTSDGVSVATMTASGHVPHMYSISIKGVVVRNDRALLLKNEREE